MKRIDFRQHILFNNSVLILTILFFIYRMALPIFKFPFIILYLFCLIYLPLKYFSSIKSIPRKSYYTNFLVILNLSVLVIAFLFSDKAYLIVIKEISSILIILSLIFLLRLVIKSKKELVVFQNIFINISIFFALLISLSDFLSLFEISLSYLFLDKNTEHLDINFATIPVFFGIVSLTKILLKPIDRKQKITINFLLLFFMLNILFSGSRRGTILILLFLAFLFFANLVSLSKRKNTVAIFGKNTNYILPTILLFSIIGYYLLFHSSGKFKNNSLRFFGIENLVTFKMNLAVKVYRYFPNQEYEYLYNKIWKPYFDPNDPDSGWGQRIHKTIANLTGTHVEIVPKGAKGYFIDATSDCNTWENNAYSYTMIGNDCVTDSKIVKASVYCYVSKDFNGDWVRLSTSGSTYGNTKSYYDLENKGKWQKLELKVPCLPGIVNVELWFTKNDVTNFKELKGHVIFAYPQYKILSEINLDSYFVPAVERINNAYNQEFIIKPNFSRIELDKHNNKFDKLGDSKNSVVKRNQKIYLDKDLNKSKYFLTNINHLFIRSLSIKSFIQNDIDPLRKWIAKLVSEDTTYYPYRTKIQLDTISKGFIVPRAIRWQFAWQVFTMEYNWKQKIFGGGFAFLNWYGYYFYKDKNMIDYPHNPFLYILLYSGIAGLILYCILLFKVVAIYWIYRQEYLLIFIFFLITYYFTFFSGGNPFDPPIMCFFMILPFFIHDIHSNGNNVDSIKN